MKPTSDERREVAAELRELAKDYEKVPAWDVIAAGELPAPIDDAFMACGLGRAVYATEIFGRLADLIEPEERTCHIVMVSTGVWECDECFGGIDWDSYDKDDPPNCGYCPNCGAKVVEE